MGCPDPLQTQFPELYSICDNPSISVAQVCSTPSYLRFRRTLDQEGFNRCQTLLGIIQNTILGEGCDKIVWDLETSSAYMVNSMYNKLTQGASVAHFKEIWKAKIPLKIRIFTWQMALDRLPSSLLIANRHCRATGLCALCGAPEDATHVFSCSMAKFAWSVL
jgi:hypothetical protein